MNEQSVDWSKNLDFYYVIDETEENRECLYECPSIDAKLSEVLVLGDKTNNYPPGIFLNSCFEYVPHLFQYISFDISEEDRLHHAQWLKNYNGFADSEKSLRIFKRCMDRCLGYFEDKPILTTEELDREVIYLAALDVLVNEIGQDANILMRNYKRMFSRKFFSKILNISNHNFIEFEKAPINKKLIGAILRIPDIIRVQIFVKYMIMISDEAFVSVYHGLIHICNQYAKHIPAEVLAEINGIDPLDVIYVEIYKIKSFSQFSLVLLQEVFDNNLIVKNCEYCNRCFVPLKRSDTKFCNLPSITNSCAVNAKTKKQLERVNNDVNAKKHRSISQMFRNKMNYSFDDKVEGVRDNYYKFLNISQEYRDKIKQGLSSSKEYNDWLGSFYKSEKKKSVSPKKDETL